MQSPRMNMVDALSGEKYCAHCGELDAWVDQRPCSRCGETVCSDCRGADAVMAERRAMMRCRTTPRCLQPDTACRDGTPRGVWPAGASARLLGHASLVAGPVGQGQSSGVSAALASRARESSAPQRMRSWAAGGVLGAAMLAAVAATAGARSTPAT
jgi:hypothetical protein